LPTVFTPLPLMATPCGTWEGLAMVIVTLPAFALRAVVLNLRAPLGSAEIFRPLLAAGVLVAGVLAAGAGVLAGVELALEELLLPPPPQPATARAAAAAPTVRKIGMRVNGSSPDRVPM
jgi:hypothetical protein